MSITGYENSFFSFKYLGLGGGASCYAGCGWCSWSGAMRYSMTAEANSILTREQTES